MIINGQEYQGTLTCDGSMHIELELSDSSGLTAGESVEIEDGNATYFNRVIVSIDGGSVICDAPAGEEDYLEALEKLGVTL